MTRELGPRQPSTAPGRPHPPNRADRPRARRVHGRFTLPSGCCARPSARRFQGTPLRSRRRTREPAVRSTKGRKPTCERLGGHSFDLAETHPCSTRSLQLRPTSLGGVPGTDEANHRSRGDRRGLDVDDGSGRPGRAALWTSSYQRQRMDRVGPRRLRLEPQSLHVERGQPVLARELAAQAAPVQVDDERSRELGRQPAQPAELHIPPRLTDR
jgi:hypothetical protein